MHSNVELILNAIVQAPLLCRYGPFAKEGADVVISYPSDEKGANETVSDTEQFGRLRKCLFADFSTSFIYLLVSTSNNDIESSFQYQVIDN
jgi:hypothetical protein